MAFTRRSGALAQDVTLREVWAWSMYDFANSGYTTVVITAVFNAYFVAAINRVGIEAPWNIGEFYGKSYFCNPRGKIVAQASRDKDEMLSADLNFDEIREVRTVWQFYRDRRPESYRPITETRASGAAAEAAEVLDRRAVAREQVDDGEAREGAAHQAGEAPQARGEERRACESCSGLYTARSIAAVSWVTTAPGTRKLGGPSGKDSGAKGWEHDEFQ